MLPQSYQVYAALVLVAGGALACFAGYRLFRLVLAVYGFILGALAGSSMMAASDTMSMLVAALAGGLVGALILFLAYFVGVALLGAGLGALVASISFGVLYDRFGAAAAFSTGAGLAGVAAVGLLLIPSANIGGSNASNPRHQ